MQGLKLYCFSLYFEGGGGGEYTNGGINRKLV